MQWIFLIGDGSLSFDTIKEVEHYGNIAAGMSGDRYYVEYGKDHIFYDYFEDTDDYEREELDRIPFKNPRFIMMTYTSENRMRSVLRQENFLKGVYVDNDNGLIVPIEEFIALGLPVN